MTMPSGNDPRSIAAFWLMTPSLHALEIAKQIGFEVTIIDTEHGAFDPVNTDRLVHSAIEIGLTVYVRVRESQRGPIQDALDSGAHGVILPQIADEDDARRASTFAKYPPLGSRGYGGGRTEQYGFGNGPSTDQFILNENRRTFCYVMIETEQALAEVNQIATLPTVDGLFIGSADLSLNRGRGMPSGSQQDFEDFERVVKAAAAAGKIWAMPTMSTVTRRFAFENGASLITVSDNRTALGLGFRQHLEAVRDES